MDISKKLVSFLLIATTLICALPINTFALDVNSKTSVDEGAQAPETSLSLSQGVGSFSFEGSSYMLFDNICASMEEAKSFCENIGGHLAIIDSQAENDAIYSGLVSLGYRSAFFGITDSQKEGTWLTVTGDSPAYTNWHSGEPNSESSKEDWAMFYWKYTNGQWNDGNFTGTVSGGKAFICEWDNTYDSAKKIVIHDREFDKNIDYYTTKCDSSEYNPTLANMLAALSVAAYDKNKIKAAYESLGFEFDDTKKYGSYDYETDDPWCCGYSISFKNSEHNDDIICLVTVRGTVGDFLVSSDWQGNLDVSPSLMGKHEGFFMPALSILKHINSIIESEFVSKDVKYVITGHSRGAAVGNLLSVALMETQTAKADNIYNYNFACPDVVSITPMDEYTNIFNLCNTEDVVTKVPSAILGTSWEKYGQTLWFTAIPTVLVNTVLNTHDMELYLSFFDNQFYQEDWPEISWKDFSGTVIKVFCPVDVNITDRERNQVASVINGKITYYDSTFEEFILVFTDGDKKYVYINGDISFNINLVGTDDGAMTFSMEKCNLTTGEVAESKTFNDVVLEKGKTMYCSVDENAEINNMSLFVVEEKDGDIIYTHTIETDGTETVIPCEHEWNNGEITKQPTHTDFGEMTFTCDDCGATKTERVKKTTVHTYGDWVVTKEATESENGLKEKTCACGDIITQLIPKLENVLSQESSTNEDASLDAFKTNDSLSLWDRIIIFFTKIYEFFVRAFKALLNLFGF